MPASAAQARGVLVIAGTLRPPPAIAELIGEKRAGAIARELLLRAARWAGEVAPGGVHVACDPADAPSEVAGLLGSEVMTFAQEGDDSAVLSDGSARVLNGGPGPLVIIWPWLMRWRSDHATGALEDLADGCDVSVGPVFDGGFYLLALARSSPELFTSPGVDWTGPDALGAAFTAAHEAGLTVGMLRAERGLRRPEDVRAALADPLTDPALRSILASA